MEDRQVLTSLCIDLHEAIEGYCAAAALAPDHPERESLDHRIESRRTILPLIRQRLSQVAPLNPDADSPAEAGGALQQRFEQIHALLETDPDAAFREMRSLEKTLSLRLRDALSLPLSLETYAMLTDFLTRVEAEAA